MPGFPRFADVAMDAWASDHLIPLPPGFGGRTRLLSHPRGILPSSPRSWRHYGHFEVLPRSSEGWWREPLRGTLFLVYHGDTRPPLYNCSTKLNAWFTRNRPTGQVIPVLHSAFGPPTKWTTRPPTSATACHFILAADPARPGSPLPPPMVPWPKAPEREQGAICLVTSITSLSRESSTWQRQEYDATRASQRRVLRRLREGALTGAVTLPPQLSSPYP